MHAAACLLIGGERAQGRLVLASATSASLDCRWRATDSRPVPRGSASSKADSGTGPNSHNPATRIEPAAVAVAAWTAICLPTLAAV